MSRPATYDPLAGGIPRPTRKVDWNTFVGIRTDMAGANVAHADADHSPRIEIDRAHEPHARGNFWTLAHRP